VENANYKFAGDYETGHCALTLLSARKEDTGGATVKVSDELETKTAYIYVNVKYLQLTSTSAFDFHQFKEHQQMDFNCTAHGVNPQKILEIMHRINLIKSQ